MQDIHHRNPGLKKRKTQNHMSYSEMNVTNSKNNVQLKTKSKNFRNIHHKKIDNKFYNKYKKLLKVKITKFKSSKRRVLLSGASMVLILSLIGGFIIYQNLVSSSYNLSVATQNLIGKPDGKLLNAFNYDSKTKSYYLYKSLIGKSNSTSEPSTLSASSTKVGANYQNTPPFSLQLPTNSNNGITTYDTTTGLSFTLIPKFKTYAAKQILGHTVYPLGLSGAKAVYTLKNNGLQEDVVYNNAPKNGKETLKYKLNLPDTLQAKMMSGGNLGIYSADPALYNNITYATTADQFKVAQARVNSAKTHLVFVIPAPKIVTADGVLNNSNTVKTKLTYSSGNVSIIASGLQNIRGEFSLDPSVIVATASNFQTGGNNDGDITFDTVNGQITESGLTGATVPSWSVGTSLGTATDQLTTVVNNGFIYEIGGNTGSASSLVQYASLNSSTGALGSWVSTTSLPVATYYSSSVAYNGYIYEIGGFTTAAVNTVYYALICTGNNSGIGGCGTTIGAVGTWNTTTHLVTATYILSSVAYNGYMYEIGGDTGSPTAVDEYAVINGDGTLGAWNTATSLPTATYGLTSVAYNGYIYELGGYTTTSSAVVDYASINPTTGALGTWQTTTVLPIATFFATSVVYNGYIYEIGGTTGSITNAVYFAPIYSNGSLGAWSVTTVLPAACDYAASTVYNGYIYELGGSTGSLSLVVDYAQIASAGVLSTWGSTSSLGSATYSTPAVAYNGYIYIVGEYTSASGGNGVTQYAAINTNGTLGTWGTTSTLPYLAHYCAALAYNGYLYVVGGFNGSSALTNVEYASIASNGTLGTWTATTGIPTATDKISAVAYNGYMYELAGSLNGPSTAITAYAPISSTGTVGTWTASTSTANGSLPVALQETAATVSNGYIYVIGGNSTGSTYVTTVYYAQIVASGALSGNTCGTSVTWCTTTAIPTGTFETSAFANNGYLYLVGGSTGSPTAVVDYAQISSSGTIGSWTATTSLLTATDYSSGLVYNGVAYSIGGLAGGTTNNYYAQINNGGPGTVSAWTASTSTSNGNLPTGTYYLHGLAYNGWLYSIAGVNGSAQTAVVDSIQIGANGSLGTWTASTSTTTGSLPNAIDFNAVTVYNGYMYSLGGYTTSYVSTVDYAALNSNGSISSNTNGCGTSWCVTTSLPYLDAVETAVVYNGYIYAIGGEAGGSYLNTVDYALICTGSNSGVGGCSSTPGTLGTWSSTTSLPTGTAYASSVVANGYVYELGGSYTGYNGVTAVEYALICTGSNSGVGGCSSTPGTLGTWNTTTSILGPTIMAATEAYNGYMYEIGGSPQLTNGLNSVDYAQINSDGTLGQWQASTVLPTPLFESAVAITNGYVYVTGGYTGSGINATTYYAALQSIPRVGNYSRLIDFSGLSGDDPVPVSIQTNGGACSSGVCTNNYNNPGIGGISGPGGIFINYKFASNSCTTFNSLTTLPYTTGLIGAAKPLIYTTNGCSTTTNVSRYMWVNYMLDDSETATFPDATGNHTSINDFTVYSHPASTNRLFGGQTFSNQQLQSYDTAP